MSIVPTPTTTLALDEINDPRLASLGQERPHGPQCPIPFSGRQLMQSQDPERIPVVGVDDQVDF